MRVPAAPMIGNPNRFSNIYVPKPETIVLDEESIKAQEISVSVAHGTTKSLADHANDPRRLRKASFGSKLRTVIETARHGATVTMGSRVVYDARHVYNGNIAHLIGHHLANLGFAKEKLGLATKDCLVILEKETPRISRTLFDKVGFETYETNRPVEGNLLDVDVEVFDPYHLAPFVANLTPENIPVSTTEKVFISRRSSRRLTNEAELIEITESHGYTTCYFEEVPLEQQWAVVRDARSIIAIHGAALGYLGMKGRAAPHFRLLEIFSPGLVADIYRKTSAVLGGIWIGCRGRLSSKFVKHVEESSQFRSQEGKDFYLHPDGLNRALAVFNKAEPEGLHAAAS